MSGYQVDFQAQTAGLELGESSQLPGLHTQLLRLSMVRYLVAGLCCWVHKSWASLDSTRLIVGPMSCFLEGHVGALLTALGSRKAVEEEGIGSDMTLAECVAIHGEARGQILYRVS